MQKRPLFKVGRQQFVYRGVWGEGGRTDAQADLSLSWELIHFVGFVVRMLKWAGTQQNQQNVRIEKTDQPVQTKSVSFLHKRMLGLRRAILPSWATCLNSGSSQCARGKSSIARNPEVHPKNL